MPYSTSGFLFALLHGNLWHFSQRINQLLRCYMQNNSSLSMAERHLSIGRDWHCTMSSSLIKVRSAVSFPQHFQAGNRRWTWGAKLAEQERSIGYSSLCWDGQRGVPWHRDSYKPIKITILSGTEVNSSKPLSFKIEV